MSYLNQINIKLVGSYRPISLINHGAKFFATVLAKRLNAFITQYIHPDQTRFMPSCHMYDSIRRSLNVIHFCKTSRLSAAILSLDAEKAFDRVETGYFQELLRAMDFGPGFLNAIQALYTEPGAQLLVNGISSEDFILSRGTRQGCPLSPILFALSLELLAAAIRHNDNIKGIKIGEKIHKLNLFADDTVFFISDPLRSLPHLLTLLEDFGRVAGFAVNYSKSEIYPINLARDVCDALHLEFKFKFVKKHWKHLGVAIPLNLDDLFKVNFDPLVNHTKELFRD